MDKKIETFLSSLVFALANLHIEYVYEYDPIKPKPTAFIVNAIFDDAYIRINFAELNAIGNDLIKYRGFKTGYLALEATLHELAHYRQYRKFIKNTKWFKCIKYGYAIKKRLEYHEKVADRYAHYCLRIILKRLKHKDLFKILLNSKILRKEEL